MGRFDGKTVIVTRHGDGDRLLRGEAVLAGRRQRGDVRHGASRCCGKPPARSRPTRSAYGWCLPTSPAKQMSRTWLPRR